MENMKNYLWMPSVQKVDIFSTVGRSLFVLYN